MFRKHRISIDETALKEIINGALCFLRKQSGFPATITMLDYKHNRRSVRLMDLFDVFYEDMYTSLSGDDFMNLPHINHDCMQVQDAELQKHSYLFSGDLNTEFHIAPVVYQGKKGIMLHVMDWHKLFPKDDGEYTGFVQAKYQAFEEDGSRESELHLLWNLIDQAYRSDDEHFRLNEISLTGGWKARYE